jgi:hypothetical protein
MEDVFGRGGMGGRERESLDADEPVDDADPDVERVIVGYRQSPLAVRESACADALEIARDRIDRHSRHSKHPECADS